MGIFAPPALSARRALNLSRLSLLRSAKYLYDQDYTVTAGTRAMLWGLDGPFDYVRLGFVNSDTTNPYTVTSAAVAPSAKPNNGIAPVDGANAAVAWTPVTFNNLGDGTFQPYNQNSGGATSLTVPAAASAADPVWAWSDWVPVPSLPRSDAALQSLLMTRVYFAAGHRATGTASKDTQFAAIANGHLQQNYFQGVDGVGTPANFTSTTTAGFISPTAVQYYSSRSGLTVFGVGDSIMQAFNTPSSNNSFGFQACGLVSTDAKPVQWAGFGYQGRTSANFFANFDRLYPVIRPNAALIPIWTRNDPLTQAAADACWQKAMARAQRCLSDGCVPILVGPNPNGSMNSSTEVFRLSARTRGLAAAASGLLFLDLDPIVGTGASPNRVQAQFDSGDGVHWNDAGHAAVAAQGLAPLLRTALA
jgi:hypothetical protein